MTQLHFRIIIIPRADEEPDTNALRKYVEQCGLVVQTVKRVQLEKAKQPHFPEILEYIVDIRAENQLVISNNNKTHVYKDLIFKWCRVTRSICIERPLLQFSDNECFVRKRVSCHSKLRLQNISFGVQASLGEYVSYASIGEDSTATLFHDLKELEIVTESSVEDLGIFSQEIKYSLKIQYIHIRNVIVSVDDEFFELYLDLLHPPLFFKETVKRNLLRDFREERRLLPFKADRLVIGKSNVVRLKFHFVASFYKILSCLRYRSDKIPIHFIKMNVTCKSPPIAPSLNLNHFGCTYMWTAITNRTFLILEQTVDIRKSLDTLIRYSLQSKESLEKVLTTLLFLVDTGRFLNYWHVIDKLFEHHVSIQKDDSFKGISVPQKCRLIRRIVVTPTRIMLWPADLMCENRILRNFDSEFFLRVTFRDDDFNQMNFRLYDPSVFQTVVSQPVNSGILIENRHYQLLAWSSSQLREHGISMYAKDSRGITAHDIRKWTEINPRTKMNIPKCLSRIGQCFSQTEDTVHIPLDDANVRFERDVEGGFDPMSGKPYIFSDGIGRISTNLVEKVRKTFRHNTECSALQIRYGGCKGMLVLDPTLRGADIVFRESMRKFDCRGQDHTKLEIVKKSGPIPLRLNRPLVAILHDLGVNPRVFLRLQQIMLQNLIDMLLDEGKAANYLNIRTPFSIFKFKELTASGICLTQEPFFRTLLLSLHRYYIDLIKTKANIDVDPDYGRNMFGVLDETGILQYGQVFVQYSTDVTVGRTTPEDTKILKGTVMVTKFPCVHPGDVRKFTAVDVPQLHHIIDCIVFPQNGPRPHPDEMAGSDLDGDEYCVVWMPELIFAKENDVPANYPKPDSQNFQNVSDFLSYSRTEEIADFIVDYIKNDTISSIATAHLAQSDQLNIHHPLCLGIARKHAVAVDFPKTGVSERLTWRENPRKYPDFMERFWKTRYKSKKSLGKMYRVSRDFETDNQATILQYHNVELDPSLVVDGWQKFEQSALAARNEYNNTLRTILQTYGVSHETEAFGGSFIKLHARFRERRDRAEIVDVIHKWLIELVERTRKRFFEGAPASALTNDIVSDIKKKASAWYVVTYRESDPEFLSFPWVVADILKNISILKPKITDETASVAPFVLKLEELILENAHYGMLPRLHSDVEFLLRNMYFSCNRSIVERAISVLSKWAEEERLISTVHAKGRFLYYKTFLKLILYIAESEGYASKSPGLPLKRHASSAELCIAFFKYCMKLRFLSKAEMKNILPFDVYNDRWLAKIALIAFHSIAVTGVFPTLCNREFMNDAPELVDMKVVSIDSSVFGASPIEESKLRNAESVLQKFSEVEQVTMRENCQRKKVIVDAYGTVPAIRRLRSVLRKETTILEDFFETGELPQNFEF
ncbi:uncharacterized protein LOC129969117 [Argiope bruennichi]|uniref:uncharacterized protein LOC129969117 n=1 Tax=Argiope bruennichi TaxID=94029 RepID=UPI0024944EA0|nr:uncharacterized protein LOC129969117 [Argiope bruennichi]XP_055939519.1 uncharacterized protein LOC129969117 [Argiope bruennichi]